jgi:hypothetical protein
MRRFGDQPPSPLAPTGAPRSDWGTLRRLFPYLWRYKWRVMVALAFMVGAKLANVGVPLLLKQLVDAMTPGMNPATAALLVVPVGLLLAYGGLRLCTTLFTELRELVFAKATQGAARSIALETFQHLHALSLRFHLERQTGGMTRDIERGAAWHRVADLLLAVQHRAHADRGGDGADHSGREVRCLVRLDHAGRAGALHHLHGLGHRVAHEISPPGQRVRFGGAHQVRSTRC